MKTYEDMILDNKRDYIKYNFSYHKPNEDQRIRHELIREAAKELAILILENTPDSPEQGAALTFLDTATFHANSAIAREGRNKNV